MNTPRVEIWFELEPACNWNCQFCYNAWRSGVEPPPEVQPLDAVIAAIDRLAAETQCDSIVLSGGEPLLRPDLLDVVRAIRRHRIPVALTTNGSLLTARKIRPLLDAGVGTFVVSLHSHREHMHDHLTGAVSWRAALNGILLLREAGADTAVVFVATRKNMHDFPALVHLCGRIGIRRVIFNRFVPAGQGFDYKYELGVPTDAELAPILRDAATVAAAHSTRISLGVPVAAPEQNQLEDVGCGSCVVRADQVRWTLGADLYVRRCNSFRGRVANVLNGEFTKLLQHQCSGTTQWIPCRILEAHAKRSA